MYDTTYVVDNTTNPAAPSVTTNGNAIEDDFSDTTMNEGKYRTHEIDLAAAVDGGVKWANGDKHVDLAKAVIEKQLRIREADSGLGDTVKGTAWQAVQDAIMDHLFGVKWGGNTVTAALLADTTVATGPTASTATRGNARADLPGDLGDAYDADRNDDFVRAAAEALEALANNNALKAALGNGGIFKGLAKANGKSNEHELIADTVNLIDRRNSRVQYAIGTTDVTRTVHIRNPDGGPAPAEVRDRFTRVLKGHIALATAIFPRGVTGSQLDMLARKTLWEAGLDYDHGTGHGVGSFLGVHEGPARISKVPSSANSMSRWLTLRETRSASSPFGSPPYREKLK